MTDRSEADWEARRKWYASELDRHLGHGTEELVSGIEHPEDRQRDLEHREAGPHFAELRGLVTNEDFEKLMFELDSISPQTTEECERYAALAASLRELDKEIFDEAFPNPASKLLQLQSTFRGIKESPDKLLPYLYNIKQFDGEFYEKTLAPKMDDALWSSLADETALSFEQEDFVSFARHYKQAAFLNFEEISGRLSLREYWPKAVSAFESGEVVEEDDAIFRAMRAADLQAIKPASAPAIPLSRTEWASARQDLLKLYMQYIDSGSIKPLQSYVLILKELKYLQIT